MGVLAVSSAFLQGRISIREMGARFLDGSGAPRSPSVPRAHSRDLPGGLVPDSCLAKLNELTEGMRRVGWLSPTAPTFLAVGLRHVSETEACANHSASLSALTWACTLGSHSREQLLWGTGSGSKLGLSPGPAPVLGRGGASH